MSLRDAVEEHLRAVLGPAAQIEVTEEAPTRLGQGWPFRTARDGRVGRITVGGDVAVRDGSRTTQGEREAEDEYRSTCRLAPRVR